MLRPLAPRPRPDPASPRPRPDPASPRPDPVRPKHSCGLPAAVECFGPTMPTPPPECFGPTDPGGAPGSATMRRVTTAPHKLRPWLPALLLIALALPPRVAGLADFLTHDEAYHWIERVERFSAALADGRWADTVQTGHPGVTTMWLGALGLALERWLVTIGSIAPPATLAHLAWLRLPHALLEALLVGGFFLLLRRLIAPSAALLATTLVALAPYLVAHARLLHLDALLTSFVMLSLLALLCAVRPGVDPSAPVLRRSWLLAAGVLGGLALLTKGPALILVAFVPPLLLALSSGAVVPRLRAAAGAGLLWGVAALATVLLLWPALWVAPGVALGVYVGEIVANGGRPNGDGQFFMGRADRDPGALFYVVSALWRSTPAMLVGLLLAPLALWRARGHERRVLLVLVAFVAWWTLVMTLGPKKFDRYALPTWPALCVLAGAGLAAIVRRASSPPSPVGGGGERSASVAIVLRRAFLALLIAADVFVLWRVHPYALSYYNPLLGGGRAAQEIFLIGWGEGLDQAGAWLSAQPDIANGPVLAPIGPALQPFVPVTVRGLDDYGVVATNYAVVYRETLQRGAFAAQLAAIRQTVPLHTVVINEIEYAWIYQIARPFSVPVDALFDERMRLAGVTSELRAGQLTITPAWDVRATGDADYTLFVHVLDARGTRVAQIDVAPGGELPTSRWRAGQQLAVPLPIVLPADLAPGEYRIVAGLYDARGGRLSPAGGTDADPALAGADALLLDTIVVR